MFNFAQRQRAIVNSLRKRYATDWSSMKNAAVTTSKGLRKAPTGIRGLDEITGGGLPHGRPTLVCGGTGCG